MKQQTAVILLTSIHQRAREGHAVRFSKSEIDALATALAILDKKQARLE